LLVRCEARVLRYALVVLSSQDTRSERTPDGCAILELLVQWGILALEAFAVEGVVLWLFCNRSDKVVLLGDLSGFFDLLRGPLGCSPLALVSFHSNGMVVSSETHVVG
jgi:hypothetical protein